MSLSDRVPGMAPGSRIRNIIVGIVYIFVILAVIGAIIGPADTDMNNSSASNGTQSTVTESSGSGEATATTSEKSTPTTTVIPSPSSTAVPTSTVGSTPALASTPQPTEIQIETPAATTVAGERDDEYYQTLLTAGLQQEDVSVDSIERDGQNATLSYTTIQTSESGLAQEIGKVAGAYAFAVGDGWDTERLNVKVLGADGTQIGTYRVESEWAQMYMNDEISAENFSLRVLSTLRSETTPTPSL